MPDENQTEDTAVSEAETKMDSTKEPDESTEATEEAADEAAETEAEKTEDDPKHPDAKPGGGGGDICKPGEECEGD